MQDGAHYKVRKCTAGNMEGGLYSVVGFGEIMLYVYTLKTFQVIRKFYISGSHCMVNISVWEEKAATRRVNELHERTLLAVVAQRSYSPEPYIYRLWQYSAAFLMFRCRNVSMHACARLFTYDLIANECRVFD